MAAVPAHLSSPKPTLDPYGHLLRMLMPRASGIAFYDARGVPLWVADGYDGPDPHPLIDEALARPPAATTAEVDGFARSFEGSPAYVFRIRDDGGRVIAVAALLTRDGEDRPFSFVLHMVRPAIECLQRELQARSSITTMSRDLQSRDQDLEVLLHVAGEDPEGQREPDELGHLMQVSVEHLGCLLGALVVPERSVAICKSTVGTRPRVDILSKTHRHLLNWAQLQRRTLVVNAAGGADGLPAVKILSVPVRHASGRAIGFMALFRPMEAEDFDLRHERLAELLGRKVTAVLQNNYDAFTSLLTRPAFENQVRGLLAARGTQGPHCVLYIDADRMHVINDNFGMHVGDEVIGKVAEVLRRRPRPGALAARISGDRFAVFLPDCPLDLAAQAAELICRQCAELSYARGDGTVQISVSVGVAELPDSQTPLAHGSASAEIACKAAKDRGRGRVEIYQDADQSIMRRHSDVLLVQRLHEAIERDRFVLYAQPILPLSSAVAQEPRFELLLRMLADNGEVQPPAKFFSAAERYQMLPAIDRWVVRSALSSLKAHAGALRGRAARFSINVTGPSIASEDFLDFLEQQVRDSGLPPEILCFELTETAAVSNLQKADRLMQRLRLLGCSFALDDFGTGLSSLAYLRSLPVSVLKIDGSFVRDAANNQRTESMVRAIAQLARTMGMDTVAEYVETDDLRLRMANLGVDYGQGFAIGKPLPLAEVLGDLALYEMLAQQSSGAA